MGLDNFKKSKSSKNKAHGHHPYNEKLETWADELEERFPIDLDINFVEVSPQMTKTYGKAFYSSYDQCYIRIAEYVVESKSEKEVKLILLHEMCHIYFYRMGYGNTGHDKYFRWVVGRVMADMTNTSIHNKKWKDCIEPFFEMQEWD